MAMTRNSAFAKRRGRRDFLKASAGAVALATFGIPRKACAAEAVNIGGLYPVTGSFAQIGQGCVNAAKLAVQMVNDAGGIKSLGGAKLNLIISDVQSDTTVTRTETDRLISSYKLSAIHGCYASALTLIASEVAERAKMPLLTGSSSDQLNQGDRHYTFTPFSRASQFAQAQLEMAEAGERPAEGGGGVREHRVRHLDLQRPARTGAGPGRGDRPVRAVLGRIRRRQPTGQQGQGFGREHAVPGLLPERPDPDRPLDQAGRAQAGHQRRLRRVRHSRVLQERRQRRGRPAGRGALEPRHRRQCPEGQCRVQEAVRGVSSSNTPAAWSRRPS